ncbi:Peptidase C19, ubiquitin-specific peptidase, DUSP domain [Plasmopara halstedii]|uniref:Peptidase C19, ubiquitin-specific peptidase, DUSP domain n=1 Tax=Plasmopara halstedii TaxID=4781 RepID=A0A0P1B6R3_PLAHL|nr:Peptidase C19, ubiquitin-specific peptidase, DUSP domain [Plasmopara halstedii]CEG50480.1 Peptidase C19, ubiquitin-specific peptidase, DUSP domain [Plasmopara halstedii]|eukprot:XP_024586849.1 Peptidase C19, ubiquitin-specific peptidase, DUSP domain [Plasmopara halstedii]
MKLATKLKRACFRKTPEVLFSCMPAGVKPSKLFDAEMDIMTWPTVEIDVPAGPLGILLDGDCLDAAVLDDFAPISPEGALGVVEESGRVPLGSVLVGMNTLDFMHQPRMTLAEIGTVLREGSLLKRRLFFKVPPQVPAVDQITKCCQASDESCLIVGSTKRAMYLSENYEGVDSEQEWSGSLCGGLYKQTTAATARDDSIDSQRTLPGQRYCEFTETIAPFFKPVMRKDLCCFESDEHPYESDMVDRAPKLEDTPDFHGVDNKITDHSVLLRLMSLSDESRAEVVEVDEKNVLHEKTHCNIENRNVSFEFQPSVDLARQSIPATSTAPVVKTIRRISAVSTQRMSLIKAVLPIYTENLVLRRNLELQLIMTYDRREIKSKEFWFVVHADWMSRWAVFVGKEGPEPGPITNHELMIPASSLSADSDQVMTVRSDIKVIKDFRFVNPMVWCLLTDLHGPGDAPPIARFSLDLNSDAPEDVNEVLFEAKGHAKGLATSLRESCQIAM